jgi:rhodanese-related sulfurtransferase
MHKEPLISAEVFDYLRRLAIEPYTKLNELAREQLGDGVRLVSLFQGERFGTARPGLRLTVLSGRVRLEPAGLSLDLDSTRDRVVLTRDGDNGLEAESDAIVLLADSGFLDTLSSWAELAAYAEQTGQEELAKRLLAVRHAVAFRRLPLELVSSALQQMTRRPVTAGEVIVEQGEPGDAFYLIRSGHAEVWKSGIYDDEQQLVDQMGPGEAFGDEALVTGGTRNATIRMVDDGELLVLGVEAFRELISRPLIEEVDPEGAQRLLDEGWQTVDVRYEEEFEDGHIPGAILLPLFELRQKVDEVLAADGRYIAVCLSGKRSAVAAFLLRQRGYRVVAMRDGMSAWTGETEC